MSRNEEKKKRDQSTKHADLGMYEKSGETTDAPPILDDAHGKPTEPAYRGEIEGREYTMEEIAAMAGETAPDGAPVLVVRTRAVIAAEWLAAKLRVECHQAEADALADELGKDLAAKGETRHPIRIGGGLYRVRKDREAKTFTILPYVAPTAIEAS